MELSSLADLLDVQDLDSQIDRLLEKRQSLPELELFKKAHESLSNLEGRIGEAAGALRVVELELDKAEGELQMLEAKLGEHETRLFAGGMSGRETEHMRLEVQGLRGQQEAMEENVLRLLEDVDPAREQVEGLQKEIDLVTAEKERLEAVIKSEWKTIDAELARRESRKSEAVLPIDSDLMAIYEKLRRIKEGVAIASFDHGVCGGCHMTLSPAEQEEAFDDEIPRCVHCRRILVG